MKLYFMTTNKNKEEEAKAFFEQTDVKAHNIEFRVIGYDVQEILDPDLKFVVGKKTLEAYRYLNQPCLVEKSGLYFDGLPELPGPLGRIIWNAVGDRMCAFLRKGDTRSATARAIIGYCDGKRIRLYEGSTTGEVAERARGDYNTSNWDPIFIPKGAKQTYAEMGRERKYKTSPLIRRGGSLSKVSFQMLLIRKHESAEPPFRQGGYVSAIDSTGERSGLQTHIATTESVSLCVRMKS